MSCDELERCPASAGTSHETHVEPLPAQLVRRPRHLEIAFHGKTACMSGEGAREVCTWIGVCQRYHVPNRAEFGETLTVFCMKDFCENPEYCGPVMRKLAAASRRENKESAERGIGMKLLRWRQVHQNSTNEFVQSYGLVVNESY